jgi:type IV pilus assembly protein PilA
MRKEKGFSLIELLIVVAIILIIAAIAIPNLLRARIAANESGSASSIRTINTAQATYVSGYPTIGYASSLSALGPGAASCPAAGPTSTASCLIDNVMASATTAGTAKSGYYYNLAPVANNGINTGYTVGSAPASFNITGVRLFCSNEDGVIRFTQGTSGATPISTSAACIAYTTLQ